MYRESKRKIHVHTSQASRSISFHQAPSNLRMLNERSPTLVKKNIHVFANRSRECACWRERMRQKKEGISSLLKMADLKIL